jgi:hypothetical protein
MKRAACLVVAMGLAGPAAGDIVIDLSRDADGVPGADFDNGTAFATGLVNPGNPAPGAISLTGRVGSVNTELELNVPTSGPISYGVDSNVTNPSVDASIGGSDRLDFTFDFDGALTGFDLVDLFSDERAILSKTDANGSADRIFVLDSFFNPGNKPAGSILLDSDQSVTDLTTIDSTFFTFTAGDVFTFSSGNGANFGLQSLTVIPTPATGALLALPMLAAMRRRR